MFLFLLSTSLRSIQFGAEERFSRLQGQFVWKKTLLFAFLHVRSMSAILVCLTFAQNVFSERSLSQTIKADRI
ncbi:24377_t:CDS:2 [Dentiscutata erythropus]|uniref:24377_t:CDS:1 n=1 Tax=Dentiscutata erythropus TaxID=1348616 RepID=A0A9N9NL66_9GLOM|nr:24377_t:CDS:2 [Dentiscutata erythropus]